jgi:hypothetical protein
MGSPAGAPVVHEEEQYGQQRRHRERDGMWSESTGPDAPTRAGGTARWSFPDDASPLELDVTELTAPF